MWGDGGRDGAKKEEEWNKNRWTERSSDVQRGQKVTGGEEVQLYVYSEDVIHFHISDSSNIKWENTDVFVVEESRLEKLHFSWGRLISWPCIRLTGFLGASSITEMTTPCFQNKVAACERDRCRVPNRRRSFLLYSIYGRCPVCCRVLDWSCLTRQTLDKSLFE